MRVVCTNCNAGGGGPSPPYNCHVCNGKQTMIEHVFSNHLSAVNATHRLYCRHAIGQHGRSYHMKCHVLKTMPDGRLKIQVYGDRYWKDRMHVVRVRYVQSDRVSIK